MPPRPKTPPISQFDSNFFATPIRTPIRPEPCVKLVGFTQDQMPHAGLLDGMFYAGGYCGHGIAMATHLGGLIARRIAGERLEHPLFDDHFAPIPLYYGRPWFLPFAGLYYRFRDWID